MTKSRRENIEKKYDLVLNSSWFTVSNGYLCSGISSLLSQNNFPVDNILIAVILSPLFRIKNTQLLPSIPGDAVGSTPWENFSVLCQIKVGGK